MAIKIPLTQGKFAIIDDIDAWVTKFKWCAHKRYNIFYAVRNIRIGKIIQTIHMHRLIMNAQSNQEVDHQDGNGLNNCRENLRICTHQENLHNQQKSKFYAGKNCSSKYKGVSWNRKKEKWLTSIYLNYKSIFLGYFDSEVEAAHTYDRAAIKYFGEFARTNFKTEEYVH